MTFQQVSTAQVADESATSSDSGLTATIDAYRREAQAASSGAASPLAALELRNTVQFDELTSVIVSVPPELKSERLSSRLIALQEWEGVVSSVDIENGEFTARLIDISADQGEASEEAEFPIEDVSDNDQDLLREGAIFRWVIGYRHIGSTKERASTLIFRRLPKWTQDEMRAADEKAALLSETIVWD